LPVSVNSVDTRAGLLVDIFGNIVIAALAARVVREVISELKLEVTAAAAVVSVEAALIEAFKAACAFHPPFGAPLGLLAGATALSGAL
jgi:hypothetical protein